MQMGAARRDILERGSHHRHRHLERIIDRFPGGDRTHPGGARAHMDGQLQLAQPRLVQNHAAFHVRIILGQVGRQHVNRVAVHAAEAGSSVGGAMADEQRHRPAEEVNAHAARPGDMPIHIGLQKTRADHHVRLPCAQHIQKYPDLISIVLAVAVQPDHIVIALVARKFQPGLHRAADPQVKRVGHHQRARGLSLLGRIVCGAVVDHQHVGLRHRAPRPLHDLKNRVLLIVRRDDDQQSVCPRVMRLFRVRQHVPCPSGCLPSRTVATASPTACAGSGLPPSTTRLLYGCICGCRES